VLETRKAVNFVGGHFRPAASALRLAKFKQLEKFLHCGCFAFYGAFPQFTSIYAKVRNFTLIQRCGMIFRYPGDVLLSKFNIVLPCCAVNEK